MIIFSAIAIQLNIFINFLLNFNTHVSKNFWLSCQWH